MKLIVGLGNPGREYEKTRHNAGFITVDGLKNDLKFPEFSYNSKFNGELSEGSFNNEKILILKPSTFMNKSGESVRLVKDFFKIETNDIFVVYDDIDLPLGSFRIRLNGSAGTHKGMKSIVSMLKSENFPRFRIGIETRGKSASINQNIESFVLEPFKKSEIEILDKVLDFVVKAIKTAIQDGLDTSMNEFNKKTLDFSANL
jgi:peptidyl-tRNA hydrolase, PTH1 family